MRPNWQEKVGVVMTSGNNDPEDWKEIIGTKKHKEDIVDNYLAGTNRAQEIINLISAKNTPKRKNIIGGVFSSKELFEEISDKLYFEYASKETPDRLKVCLAKSAYNYFISVLQEKTIDGLNKAFETAIKNKGIAFFLSRKAQKEGIIVGLFH